jgi:hypothetical protein
MGRKSVTGCCPEQRNTIASMTSEGLGHQIEPQEKDCLLPNQFPLPAMGLQRLGSAQGVQCDEGNIIQHGLHELAPLDAWQGPPVLTTQKGVLSIRTTCLLGVVPLPFRAVSVGA